MRPHRLSGPLAIACAHRLGDLDMLGQRFRVGALKVADQRASGSS